MNKRFTLPAAVLLATTLGAHAQRYMGVATGNYLPTKSLHLNPALLADSRLKWSIDIFSMNALLDQNYGTIQTKGIMDKLNNGVNLSTVDNILTKGNRQKFDLMGGVDISLFNIHASIKNKHHFAFTNRIRTGAAVRNYDAKFFNSLFTTTSTGTHINVDNMRLNANMWNEMGLSYATTLWQNKKHAISFGTTLKYLSGLSYMGTNITGLNATILMDTINHSLGSLATQDIKLNGSTNGGFNGDDLVDNITDRAKNIFDGKAAGFGADIGFTYELKRKESDITYEMNNRKNNIDPTKNRYRLRISAALTDFGTIKYKNTTNLAASGAGLLSIDSISKHISDIPALRRHLQERGIQTRYTDAQGSQKIHLPATLVFGADYNINNRFFVNATYINAFIPGLESISPFAASQVTFTPRYENSLVTVGLPITYNFFTESMKAGLGLRVSGFYIGTDDAYALVANNKAKGMNFYMGAQIPFLKKRLKDKDGDKVSNKFDKCEGVAGLWEDQGCPPKDKDKDGIVDSLDACPDVFGLASAKGCPDADGDGVADGTDLCPDLAGSAATNGCPDRDNDGIADKDDKCPDVAGTAQFQGCNDSDNDGIADWEDACPNQAGPLANKGCPDTDNDGIPDHMDKCPTVPGTHANRGCPEVKAEVKKRLAFAATAIQFETGKTVIKKTSYPLLDEIVAILTEYSDYGMTIDGHTDNTGKADKNLAISQGRAEAVKTYFTEKGINPTRIITVGHGQESPVADNKTASGRAKNRRVDMDLKLMD